MLFGEAKDLGSNEIFDLIILLSPSHINLKLKNKNKNNNKKTDKAQMKSIYYRYMMRADSKSGIEPSSFSLPTNNALPLGHACLHGSDLFASLV